DRRRRRRRRKRRIRSSGAVSKPLSCVSGRGWRGAPGEGRVGRTPHPPFGHLLPASGEKDLECSHQIHLLAIKNATNTIFTNASGRNTFQPARIRMSYFNRGIVQRIHTKTKRRKLTLTRKAIADSRKPRNVGGSLYQGMSHPPRKRVVIRADIVAMAMYSDMK